MRSEDIRDLVRRQPFQPFRLTLTDGRTYDVHHPALSMVGRSTVAIGVPRPGELEPIYDRLMTISPLHIMQVEPLESASPPA